MKFFAFIALILVGLGGGGLLGAMVAYTLSPTSVQLDINKTIALGATIGVGFSLLMLLHTLYTDYKYRKKS